MASKRTQNGSTPPNALSRPRVARQIAARLGALQEQRLELELVQEANDAAESDPVPGMPPKQENGTILYEDGQPVFPTYAERYAEIDAAQARVWKRAQTDGVSTLVEKLLEVEIAEGEEAIL